MAIGIDELDDDFEFESQVQDDNQNQNTNDNQNSDDNQDDNQNDDQNNDNQDDNQNDDNQQDDNQITDALSAFLKTKGIDDITKIKFENENGETEELDWNSLTPEEQLNILNDNPEPERDLDDSEIDLINRLRSSNLTPDEFVAMIKQQGASEYARSLEEAPKYQIDDLNDDELFILDLQTRIEDITEEEAMQALEKAKSNETLFAKQVQGIRSEYKRIEDENNQRLTLQEENERKEQYQQFQDSVLSEIQNLNKIGDLDIELDVDEMNDVASFILSEDGAGINYFSKALNDPKQLVKMAWFALKGEEAIDNISNYFKNQIKEVSRQQYQKGLEDGKSGKSSRVVARKQTPSKKQTDQQFSSIDDLD